MAIRVVVLGLGQRGRDWVRTLRAAPGFELAGAVEPDPATRRTVATELGLGDGRVPRPLRRGPRREVEELTLLGQLGRAITDGTEPESSGHDNLQTIALLEACARSASEERSVNPQELFDEPL